MSNAHKTGIQGWAWLNVIVGALIVGTPFFTGEANNAPLWNAVILGLIIVAMAGYNVYNANQAHTERAFGPAMVNVLAGIYVLAMPFFMAVNTAYTWTMVVFGVVVLAAGAYNAWASSDAKKNTLTA